LLKETRPNTIDVMSRIILQPAGNKDASDHYNDTIENPVDISTIASFLSDEDQNVLNEIYPSGSCYIWGVTPGGSNPGKWNRINRGDVTLFARNNKIYASAVTTYKSHNKELALDSIFSILELYLMDESSCAALGVIIAKGIK
jgi:hypothetical protein